MKDQTRIIFNQGKEIILPGINDIRKGEKLFINQDQTSLELTVTDRSHAITIIESGYRRTLTIFAE